MRLLQEKFAVSERRACRAVGQGRSSQRYRERGCGLRVRLVKRLHELAARHPRFGYRRMTALLRAGGWRVNKKRIQRLWRLEGLRVPARQHKRLRLGTTDGSISRRRAAHRREIWSYDFVMDQTEDGRRLKMLPVVDEFSRECLTVEVARHFTAADVIRVLDRLFKEHGAPRYLRSDNGPELVARAVKEWLAQAKVETHNNRAGESVAKRVCRVVQLALPGRVARPRSLYDAVGSESFSERLCAAI